MQIIFIGNSYTYYNDMPSLFQRLANSNGKSITVCSITKGGRMLESYTDASDETTAALDALLARETFDFCFIQEQSILPASDYDRFIKGLDCVVSKLTGRTGRIALYATWGRKSGSPDLAKHNWTTESMTRLLSEAYQKAAQLYGACVSPVGSNFLYVTQNHPQINLYDADLTHPSYQGSCLAALTHYYTVFHAFPEETEVLALGEEEILAFKAAVCR